MNQPRQDQTGNIDVFTELSSDGTPRDRLARVAGDDQLTYNDRHATGDGAPATDDEQTVSEVEIRERLIEWLVGFLPSGPRADQASL
jgi:hypothetical protein